ncbi:MAG: hypothetical protein NC342_00215 [Pseudoflavonifractor sp.]|nr:hypothetical protein [Alloprevotella sp.]MCM1115951.1 hypothetical protein [Pseudoflavonifractor sp.]
MTFTLSIDAMMRHVYARSAMAWLAAPAEARPVALQPDHAPALRELLRGACARLCLELLPYVESTNFDEIDPEGTIPFLVMDLRLLQGVDASTVRAALEMAVTLTALSGAMAGVPAALSGEAEAVEKEAERALATLAKAMSETNAAASRAPLKELHITPHYI